MTSTKPGRIVLPDDPVELRALLHRRCLERARRLGDPHGTPKGNATPETDRPTKEPQRNPSKRTSTKPKPYKPYRVIRLTGEEARAISEGKLTVEAVKTANPDRDDDIPERRAHDRGPDKTPSEKGEAREMGQANDIGRTSPLPKTGPDTRTGQVQETGPEKIPAGAGRDRETSQAQEEGRARHRQEGQGHDEGRTSKDRTGPQHEIDPDTRSGRVHDIGPEETPSGADIDRDADQVQDELDEMPAGAGTNRETDQTRDEGPASYRHTGQAYDEGQAALQPRIGPDKRDKATMKAGQAKTGQAPNTR